MSDEEPVARSNLARPDGVLDRVRVELRLAVVQMRGERRPLAEQIRASLAEAGAGQHPLLQRDHQSTQSRERPGKVFLPGRRAAITDLLLVPLRLERVKF